jgi:hypothetical protein
VPEQRAGIDALPCLADLLVQGDQTLPFHGGAGRLRLAEIGLKTRKRGRSRFLLLLSKLERSSRAESEFRHWLERRQRVDSVGQPATGVGWLTQEPIDGLAMRERRVDTCIAARHVRANADEVLVLADRRQPLADLRRFEPVLS